MRITTGKLCSLLGLEAADQLATHYLRGAIFENWVIAEVIKQHVNAGRRPDPLLLARQHRQRVRLALRTGGRRQVVEVKAGATLGTDQSMVSDGYLLSNQYRPVRYMLLFLRFSTHRNTRRCCARGDIVSPVPDDAIFAGILIA